MPLERFVAVVASFVVEQVIRDRLSNRRPGAASGEHVLLLVTVSPLLCR